MASNEEKKKKTTNIMGNLPSEIISHIFSRLPFDSVIQCRCVCRSWRGVIADSLFNYMYTENHSVAADSHLMGFMVSLQTLPAEYHHTPIKYALHYGDYNGSIKEIKKSPSIGKIVGSCNGLICSIYNTVFDMDTQSRAFDMLVMNPLTGERVNLPRMYMDNALNLDILWGFGCHPSCTNEYKVVGINCHPPSMEPEVQVYTLGSGTVWRYLEEILHDGSCISGSSASVGVLLDGCLHWLNLQQSNVGKEIVSFDLVEEKLVAKVPSLPVVLHNNVVGCCELGVLGRSLCVSKQKVRTGVTTIRTLDEQNKVWIKKYKLRWESPWYREYKPVALTQSGKLILLLPGALNMQVITASYDPETKKLERIGSLGDSEMFADQGRPRTIKSNLRVGIIPHVKSFVSLKRLSNNAGMIL